MTTQDHTAASSDEPARLTIDGPIATITLNRPAAFNSIDLSIAKKLEAASAPRSRPMTRSGCW
jgi:enoyl-CoA hydratase/carnithine racemase